MLDETLALNLHEMISDEDGDPSISPARKKISAGARDGLRGGPHPEQRQAVGDGPGLRVCGDGTTLAATIPGEPDAPSRVLRKVDHPHA